METIPEERWQAADETLATLDRRIAERAADLEKLATSRADFLRLHDAKMSHPAGQPHLLERAAKPKPTIVIARRRGKQFVDAPDMTPEKHRRRGDAANALFRELSAWAAGKDRT